ncbi:rho GTPase-activating protein 23 isoform X2 [Parasteatoda tepidariorum]|uniref:rho GTPase-activating protein 23 isoform X1 n=1 Tax=Parasteatoda tepidariorum TaxID=114398 RepID=UPI0039BC92B3
MDSSNVRANHRRYTTDLNHSRPRTVTLVKDKSGFGFTLRHFIVYPPTSFNSGKNKQVRKEDASIAEAQWKLDCRNKPMDTIFIREVKEDSPAYHAGLNKGDRILAINNHPLSGKSYSEIIHLILRSGHTLRLLVVPKEDDILQLYFASSAYQPVHRQNKEHKYLLPAYQAHNDKANLQYRQSNYGTYPGRLHHKSKASLERGKQENGSSVVNYQVIESQLPNNVLQEGLNSSHLASGLDKKEDEFSVHDKYDLDTSCFSEDEGYYHHSKDLKCAKFVDLQPPKLKDTVANLYYTLCSDKPSVFAFSSEDNLNYPIYMSDFDGVVHCDNMAETKNDADASEDGVRHISYPFDRSPFAECNQSCDSVGNGECVCHSDSRTPVYWAADKVLNPDEADPHFQVHPDLLCRKPSERNSISSAYDFRDNPNIPSINLVAQRRHQFESGNLLAESMERMNLYRSELSRMSKANQVKIVSSRTAAFENKSLSPTYSFEKPAAIPDAAIPALKEAVYVNSEEIQAMQNARYASLDLENENKPNEDILTCDVDSGQAIEKGEFNPCAAGVVHRRKTVPASSDPDECHIVRRISYLRATANERMNLESDLSEEDETSDISSPNKEYRIQKLKSFFGEKTPKVKQAMVPVDINEDDTTCDSPATDTHKTVYGWVICKVVSLEGKRSSDRSWRHLWAILRDNILYLLKERREPSKGTLTGDEHVINVKFSVAKVANDYVKRKHVLRLLLLNGTEYLVQTESHNSMMEWLKALQIFTREITEIPEWLRNTSVLEKAKAYEQHLHAGKGKSSNQPHNVKKLVFRHRNPSEHSPTIKSRRASQGDELALTKIGVLWRDRMLQGWKRVHGVNSHIPKGSSFGVKLENAPPGITNEHVPLLVELCVQIVESRGLDVVGIYRVPGNNASVSVLTDLVNQGIDDEALKDSRWNDVNIVSSLLKAYFRKLPEPLLTSHLYPKFIQASEIDDPVKRLKAIKHVLYHLPVHYFATLRFLMYHLRKVVEHSTTNKMEARNLAIVFGPTLVRATDNNMVAMVTDMPQQCYLIETMITYVEWLFEDCGDILPIEINAQDKRKTHPPSNIQSSALLSNINKIDENAVDSLPHEMFSSIYNVASRHLRHRHKKKDPASYSKKRSGIIADDTDIMAQGENGTIPIITCNNLDVKPNETENLSDVSFGSCSSLISGSSVSKQRSLSKDLQNGSAEEASPMSKGNLPSEPQTEEHAVGHKYNKLSEMAQEKIRNFEQETKALLRRDFQKPRASVGTPQVEWEQIEKEWQKAKLELEQEDLLDYLADDPSYLSCLLSRGKEEFSPNDPGMAELCPTKTELPRSLSSGKELLSCQSSRTSTFLKPISPLIQSDKSEHKAEVSLTSLQSDIDRTKLEKPEIPMSISQPALASVFSQKTAASLEEYSSSMPDADIIRHSSSNANSEHSESKKESVHQMDQNCPQSTSSKVTHSSHPS